MKKHSKDNKLNRMKTKYITKTKFKWQKLKRMTIYRMTINWESFVHKGICLFHSLGLWSG